MNDDHRTLVGAQRREKMKNRLIEATIRVVAQNGLNDVVIEDIITAADVSRGTFYKYFDSVLLAAAEVKKTLGEEMIRLVLTADHPSEDIVDVVALDLLRFFATSQRYPLTGQFAAKLGFHGIGKGNLLHTLAPDYLERGMKSGRFCQMPQILALDIMQLGSIAVFKRLSEGEEVDPAEAVAAFLRMLGVSAADANKAAAQPYEALVAKPGSFLARTCEYQSGCTMAAPMLGP